MAKDNHKCGALWIIALVNSVNTADTAICAVFWRMRLSIAVRSKITLGYLLAMGIPAIGALAGLSIGNWQQRSAINTLQAIYQDRSLLNRLEAKIAKTRLAQELGPYVLERETFSRKGKKLQSRIEDIRQLTIQLESSQTPSAIAFIPELKAYRPALDRFSTELDLMIAVAQPGIFSPDQIEERILSVAQGEDFIAVSQFTDQVTTVLNSIDREVMVAQDNLERAELLRSQIIVGSILAALLVSSVLIVITVQTISRPLESLTKVADALSRDGNTNVRAEVLANDETGKLAIAINQLIDWVNTYTSDLKTAQLHLIQAEKMSSVGQLVAGVAHEINNPVSFIHGNIRPIERYTQDLIEVIQAYQTQYPEPPEELQKFVEDIDLDFVQQDLLKTIGSMKMGTTRIREIVLSLRNFSRLDEAGSKHVDIHEGIENTLLILEHRLKEGSENAKLEIVKDYGDLPKIECFPGQLNQVFMNLLSNAIDALEASGLGTEKTILIATRLIGGDRVQIEMADTGSGMTEAVRSRIFDPFFTTKPVGKGTGLGLSISYQIVTEQHNGKMTCESTLGKGTQFMIELPMTQSKPTN